MTEAQIVIVEDEGITAMDLEDRLTRLGYRVPGIACSGREAIELVASAHPDLVLMDIRLEGDMDGIETARQLRAQFDVPVAYLTAYADDQTVRRAQETGPYGYILKPFMERELHAAIQMALQRRALEQQLREELAVNAALARVSESLILGLGAHDLLERLCRETASVLSCDFAHTWLWEPDSQRSVAMTGFGHSAEEWEAIRLFKQPPPRERIAKGEVWQISAAQAHDPQSAAVIKRYGMTQLLYVPLRRGVAWAGVLVAGYRKRKLEFSPEQTRIAGRIGQFASLVLEHARVVDKLELANRTQANLTAALSHELRGTLGAILGYIDLIKRGEYGDVAEPAIETLTRIESRVYDSTNIIQAALDISRAEVKPMLQIEPVSIASLFTELLEDARAQSPSEQVRIIWDVPEDLPEVQTDAIKLKMILVNLIENAVKFTAEGDVVVRARLVDKHMELSVTDNGPGIPAEVHDRIFEPFERVHTSKPGSGLGLYIVRRLVDLLGGTISLTSEVGKGSTFCVRVPQTPAGNAVPRTPAAA